jgi:hypothetical protein
MRGPASGLNAGAASASFYYAKASSRHLKPGGEPSPGADGGLARGASVAPAGGFAKDVKGLFSSAMVGRTAPAGTGDDDGGMGVGGLMGSEDDSSSSLASGSLRAASALQVPQPSYRCTHTHAPRVHSPLCASAPFQAGAIEAKYRALRQTKLAARDRAQLVVGRQSLVGHTRDVAASGMLGTKGADRWKK